jgi:hypothetical protein
VKRAYIIAGIFIVIAAVSSAQIPGLNLTLPVKKGAIVQAWIEPDDPNSSIDVTLNVSMADPLLLDRAEVQRTSNTYSVKIYWDDPVDSNSITTMNHQESLGILSSGFYLVNITSFYKGQMVDNELLSFRVIESPSSWAAQNIDNIWIAPSAPSNEDIITLHVSGKWPTSGFSLRSMMAMAASQPQGNVTLYMYWSSPRGEAETVVTPYEHEYVLQRPLKSGTYTFQVKSYLDGRLVDWKDMSFGVYYKLW